MDQAPVTLQALQEFCYPAKHNADHPYANRGRIVATNGRILVSCDPSAVESNPATWPKDGFDLDPKTFPFDHESLQSIQWVDVPAVEIKYVQCGRCGGTGMRRICQKCNGEGEIFEICPCCGAEREGKCPECRGKGSNPTSPETKCSNCDGSGKIVSSSENMVDVGSETLNAVYLEKISRLLPGAKIEFRPERTLEVVRFKFHGGLGYLMPCRK